MWKGLENVLSALRPKRPFLMRQPETENENCCLPDTKLELLFAMWQHLHKLPLVG
jgi:hypothetical protein